MLIIIIYNDPLVHDHTVSRLSLCKLSNQSLLFRLKQLEGGRKGERETEKI